MIAVTINPSLSPYLSSLILIVRTQEGWDVKRFKGGLIFVALVSVVTAWAQETTQYYPLTKGSKWVYDSTAKITVDLGGMAMDFQDTKGTTTIEIVGPSEQVKNPQGVVVQRIAVNEKGTVQGQDDKWNPVTIQHIGWAGEWLSMFQERREGIPGQLALTEIYNAPLRLVKKATLKEGDSWEVGTVKQGKLSLPTRVKVAAPEDVTVPAGAFKQCLKLVTEVTEPKGQIEGTGIVLNVKKGKYTTTSWYAPNVGLVKEESASSMTLEVMGMVAEVQRTATRVLQPGYKVAQ
jgi:hypothetical protein